MLHIYCILKNGSVMTNRQNVTILENKGFIIFLNHELYLKKSFLKQFLQQKQRAHARLFVIFIVLCISIRNSKILKGQTEIVKLGDRQDHGQQNEMKDKHRTPNTTLKTKAGVTRNLQLPGRHPSSYTLK